MLPKKKKKKKKKEEKKKVNAWSDHFLLQGDYLVIGIFINQPMYGHAAGDVFDKLQLEELTCGLVEVPLLSHLLSSLRCER